MAFSGDSRTRAQVEPEALRRRATCRPPTPTAARSASSGGGRRSCGARRRSGRRARSTRTPTRAAVLMEPNAGTNGIVAPDNYWPGLRAADARARRLPDRRRGDERLRPLRRVVRVAAPRRGGTARPDDARQGADRRAHPAGRGRALAGRGLAPRTPDALHGPHLLRSSARVRRWRCRRRMRTRTSASSSARERWARGCSQELQAMQRRHPVIGDVRGGHGLFAVLELVRDRDDARAARGRGRTCTPRCARSWPARSRRACPSPSAATSSSSRRRSSSRRATCATRSTFSIACSPTSEWS